MSSANGLKSLNETYQVGVVGAGHIATHYHLPLLDFLDATRIAYISDVDESVMSRAAGVYGTDTHLIENAADLPECDVVLLAVPVAFRAPYIREFGERGTPIFAEKPFALDRQSHQEFLDWATQITCNYTRMQYCSSNQMKRLFESGMFGSIERIVIRRAVRQTATGKDEGQIDPSSRGGLLHEHGAHLFSQLQYILEGYGFTVVNSDIEWNNEIDIDIEAELEATWENKRIPIDFDFSFVREEGREISFEFENATLYYDPSVPDAQIQVRSTSWASGDPYPIEIDEKAPLNHEQAMASRWLEFLTSLEAGENDSRFESGFPVSKMITDIFETAGRWPGD